MSMVQCSNGHFYNAASGGCPHCQGQESPPQAGKTIPLIPPKVHVDPWQAGGNPQAGIIPPKPIQQQVKQTPSEDAKTVRLHQKEEGVDPVVGWLVCIEGKDRGRDYRIHSERNTIGRSAANDISIAGDPSISRENQATVIYDPKRKEYRLLAGGGRGLVYVNDQVVDYTAQLKEGDTIEMGETKLLFVPLCGSKFQW